jgi:hypothetical protein
MGWELRHGRMYLYRNYRANGVPVKEYLAADDRFGFGDRMAYDLDRLRRRGAKLRKLRRRTRAEYRGRIDDLLRATAAANGELRVVAEGALYAVGFHRHNRGEWRMRRQLALIKQAVSALEKQRTERTPILNYAAPENDAEAVEWFAKARAGDTDAQSRVHALIRERKWQEWLGDIGRQATVQLVRKAAGGDPVWEAGITQKANALQDELLGEKPTVLEKLLVRRVVNGWICTHALELELTVRPPAEARDRAHLDKALSRAQRRMTDAARELVRVRNLAVPAILVNVADKQLNVVMAGA